MLITYGNGIPYLKKKLLSICLFSYTHSIHVSQKTPLSQYYYVENIVILSDSHYLPGSTFYIAIDQECSPMHRKIGEKSTFRTTLINRNI